MADKKRRKRPSKDGLYLRGTVWWANIRGERISTHCKDRTAARIARTRLEREDADPRNAAARSTTVGDMIRLAMDDRANAPGRTGGTLAAPSLGVWRTKLGHVSRVLGKSTLLFDVDYDAVGRFLARRKDEGASQHTRHKELFALRFALRLARQRGTYPHDIDHVTRTGRFAKGYIPRKRHLAWEDIPKLLGALLAQQPGRVAPETLARVRALRAAGVMVKDIAAELGVTVSTVVYYSQLDPKPSAGAKKSAQQAAWMIATAGRRSEAARAELADHDLAGWVVRVRGKKTAKSDRLAPIAPPFRPLLVFALDGRPKVGPIFGEWTNAGRCLKLACQRAGLEPLSPNDLRRTHASLLRQAGVPLEDIAPIMGHEGTKMLELVYGHTTNDAVARSISRASSPIGLVLSPDANTLFTHSDKNTLKTPGET